MTDYVTASAARLRTEGENTLEDKIIRALRSGPLKFRAIAEATGAPWVYGGDLDRTLQKLKRAGRIRASDKGWLLTDRQPCPHCNGSGYTKT